MKYFNLLFTLAFYVLPSICFTQDSETTWAVSHAERNGFESVTVVTTYHDSSLKEESKVYQTRSNIGVGLVSRFLETVKVPIIQFKDTLKEYNQETQLLKHLFFDVQLQALTKAVFLKDELISQQFDFYDQDGRLIRSLEKMPYLEKERVWEFDAMGRKKIFKEKVKDSFEGNMYESCKKYIYTRDGKLRQVNQFDKEGMLMGYIRYQYDTKGFLKAAYRYEANELYAQTRFFYE